MGDVGISKFPIATNKINMSKKDIRENFKREVFKRDKHTCKVCKKKQEEKDLDVHHITDRNEMAKLYSMADVFVNVTLEDSLPTVNIEAQACGTPVITYESGGSPETISERTGLVVPKGDKEALLIAILKIKDRGKVFYEQNCLKHVEENFIIKDRYEEYVDLYKNIKEGGVFKHERILE